MNTSTVLDASKLLRVVNDMDGLAQGALSEIRAIAQLTLAAMESRDSYPSQDVIALALRSISGTACSVADCISSYADEVGGAHSNEDELRRQDAYRASLNKQQEWSKDLRALGRGAGSEGS